MGCEDLGLDLVGVWGVVGGVGLCVGGSGCGCSGFNLSI